MDANPYTRYAAIIRQYDNHADVWNIAEGVRLQADKDGVNVERREIVALYREHNPDRTVGAAGMAELIVDRLGLDA